MSTPPQKKSFRQRPPPIVVPINFDTTQTPSTPFKQIIFSPGSFIDSCVLTPAQQRVVDEIVKIRDSDSMKAAILNETKLPALAQIVADGEVPVYLTSALFAEDTYIKDPQVSLVTCLTHDEGVPEPLVAKPIYHYNVKDCAETDILRKLDDIVQWIDAQLEHGKKVVIHCYAGINRSASIALAYHCIKTSGANIVSGYVYLSGLRPGILTNTEFIKQLVVWADKNGYLPPPASSVVNVLPK